MDTCKQKQGFPTRAAAQETCDLQNNVSVERGIRYPYYCKQCERFHITGKRTRRGSVFLRLASHQ